MFAKKRVLFVFISALLCFTGCQGKEQQFPTSGKDSKVLARVNGSPITAADVAFSHREGHGDEVRRTKSLDDIIDQELLYQQGLKLGLDKDLSYRQKLAKLDRQPAGARRIELARRVFNTQIASKINLMPKDGKDYFDKNADKIATELHLEFMKFDDKQKAEEALKKIRGGAVFEAIARSVMGTEKVAGREPWNLGFQKWQQIPVDFVDPVYRLKPGEVSEVLGNQQTDFQIVKLVAARKIPKLEYAPISAIVMNRLRDLKLLEAYYQYIAQLKKDATIMKY